MGSIKNSMKPTGTSTSAVAAAAAAAAIKRVAAISGRSNQLLIVSVVIVIAASSVLSVDAIKCHQCNSHLEPSCAALSIPKAPKTDEYLKECNGNYEGHVPFCRKTAVVIEHSEEQRIVRSCGWINENNNRTDRCLNADNEGYIERICVCFSDGCNSAPLTTRSFSLYSIAVLAALVSLLMRFV